MTIISPRRHLATALNERRLGLSSQYKDFIEFEFKHWEFQFITRRNRGHMR
jgi:hypothetical protein